VDQEQQSRWRGIVRQVSWIIVVVLAVATALFVINHFFVHRSLWDWLQLLIVPVVLARGGLWFNAQQREREQQLANERAQDKALQAYLDQMSDMLIPLVRTYHRCTKRVRATALAPWHGRGH
jgi:Flp pilus assembly protein TadB